MPTYPCRLDDNSHAVQNSALSYMRFGYYMNNGVQPWPSTMPKKSVKPVKKAQTRIVPFGDPDKGIIAAQVDDARAPKGSVPERAKQNAADAEKEGYVLVDTPTVWVDVGSTSEKFCETV